MQSRSAARVLQQAHATNVQLGGPLTMVVSNVHHAPKVLLQLLMGLRVSHVQVDISSHRIPKEAHTVQNVQQDTYSRTKVKVPAQASTGSMPKIVRAKSF